MAVAIFTPMWITPETLEAPPGFTSGRLRRSSVVSAVGEWAARGLQQCASARTERFKSGRRQHEGLPQERRRPDSNRGIKALQASALPLGYGA